ncbi:MAG: sel1 repeat family protein [Pseudomonadales bacterium]|jgi:TPR repeat protein|nr:sel1 repeat family protein [Pseudomonadales bacterium]
MKISSFTLPRMFCLALAAPMLLSGCAQQAPGIDESSTVIADAANAEPVDAREQYALGVQYQTADGVPKDDAKALAWLRKAADQGLAEAQLYIGWMYQTGDGVAQDDAQALAWIGKAAQQGLADAQVYLGWMYQNGLGVAQDKVQAVAWYRQAAEQGSPEAQASLDVLLAQ